MAAIVLLALILRLIYLFQIRSWPFFYHPILDSRTQYKWATILLQSWGLGNPEVLAKPPLYSYYLALNQWLLGERAASLFSAHLLQLVMGALNCGLTYLLGRRVFGEGVGVLAGTLAALYSPGIYRDGQLLDTALATLLAITFLLALLGALSEPNAARWLKAGLLLGLLGLTRSNLLLLSPLALGLLVIRLRTRADARTLSRMAVLFILGMVLPILPITARNYFITGMLVPISTNGGINFYTGNNPQADGCSPIPSGIAWERTWYEALAAGKMRGRAQDAYWRAKALGFWREQPARALVLLVKKLYLYWNAYEIPNNVSYDWGRAHASILRVAPFTFAVIGPLGLLGIALCGWRSRGAWTLALYVATHMLAVVIFFVCGRYRMPVVPVLCVFAGSVPAELGRLAGARRRGALALSLAGLAAFSLLVNSDAYGTRRNRAANRDWFYLGQSCLLAEDHEKAKEAFRRAAEQDPRDPDAYALLGMMEMRTGEPQDAASDMKRALEIAPDFATTAARLARLYIQQGWGLAEPEQLLRRALQHQPTHVQGLVALVRVNIRQGQLKEAQANLEAAAVALARWNRRDTRRAGVQQELLEAAAEAQAAGIPLPQGL